MNNFNPQFFEADRVKIVIDDSCYGQHLIPREYQRYDGRIGYIVDILPDVNAGEKVYEILLTKIGKKVLLPVECLESAKYRPTML